MTDEPRIRTTLEDRAASLDVPAPPLPDIVARGRRAARRRGLAAAGAASLAVAASLTLVAVLTGTPEAGRSAPPAGPVPEASSSPPAEAEPGVTLEELPDGPAPGIAFVQRGTLHHAGRTYDLELAFDYRRGGSVVLGQYSAAIYRIAPSGPQRLVQGADSHVVSVGGRYAAWVTSDPRTEPVVAVWDLVQGREVGRAGFPGSDAQCCDNPFMLQSVDDSGRVIAMTATTAWSWIPGQDGEPRELRWGRGADGASYEPSSHIPQAFTAGGMVVREQTGAWQLLDVYSNGGLTVRDSIVADLVSWSDEGYWTVVVDGDRVSLREDAQDDYPVAWPADVEPGGQVVWESDDAFLMSASSGAPDNADLGWIRCHAVARTCERVDAPRSWQPVQR